MKALAFLLPLLLANGRADAKYAPSSLHAAVAITGKKVDVDE